MQRTSDGASRTAGRWTHPLFWVCALGCLSWATGCGDEPICGDRPLNSTERSCLVDEITERVESEYPFADLNGLDLDEWSDEVGELAERDLGEVEFLRELEKKVSELHDGHTNLGWAAPGRGARPPFEAEMLEQGCFVTEVGETDARLERGDRIVEMGGESAEHYFDIAYERVQASTPLARRRIASLVMLAGPPKTSMTLKVAGKGKVEVTRKRPRFSSVPTPQAEIFDNIGYIVPKTFGYVDDIERMDRLINDMMETDGLIIDMRSNGGGVTAVPDALLGRLMEDPPAPFHVDNRNGETEAELEPGPRGEAYDGPVAVLTNSRTFSAANYFAHRVQYHDRGVVVGRRTGGGAGLPNPSVELARGVYFRVSGDVVRTEEGNHTEKGVSPDIELPVTPEFLDGSPAQKLGEPERDRTLRRAIEHLRSQSQ